MRPNASTADTRNDAQSAAIAAAELLLFADLVLRALDNGCDGGLVDTAFPSDLSRWNTISNGVVHSLLKWREGNARLTSARQCLQAELLAPLGQRGQRDGQPAPQECKGPAVLDRTEVHVHNGPVDGTVLARADARVTD